MRTDLDLDLADTGVLRIDGTLHRAAMLGQMPFNLKVEWSGVPLGQLSRLMLGSDIGWRGGLDVEAQIGGTAELAQINTRLKVAGLHRSEFTPAHPLDVATSCRASFRKESRSLEDISCASPVGDGGVLLTGSIEEVQTLPQAELTLAIHRVPASAMLAGLQEVRSGLGAGVQAAGALDGHFDYSSQSGRPPLISGEMALDSLSLTPSDAGKPFLLVPVRLRCESTAGGDATGSPALLLQPVRLAMGAPVPVTVDGRFTSAGFDLHLSGATSLARLQAFKKRLARLGARRPSRRALGGCGAGPLLWTWTVRGKWLLPVPTPRIPSPHRLRKAALPSGMPSSRTSYLSQPLRIASAQGILSPTQIAWTNASIQLREAGGTGNPGISLDAVLASTPCVGHFSLVVAGAGPGGAPIHVAGKRRRR